MRVKLKRVLSFVSAVVICGVSCVTSWFSVPVSAVGVFSPFNFYQLYQMLHGLLLGDGGGNSQTFGEWLEKNMTRTIGSGNDKHVFLLTPGEKLEDMMSEASIRLALGAACTDGGAAGISKMKDLIDSWTEVYDSAGDVGSWSSTVSDHVFSWGTGRKDIISISSLTQSDLVTWSGSPYGADTSFCFSRSVSFDYPVYYAEFFAGSGMFYSVFWSQSSDYLNIFGVHRYWSFSQGNRTRTFPDSIFGTLDFNGSTFYYSQVTSQFHTAISDLSDMISVNSVFGGMACSAEKVVKYFLGLGDSLKFDPVSTGSFVGPVYAMPAAKQLVTDTGTLSGLRLDVQTEDGTPDISAALDHAGVESVDDLVAGVAAGTIPMSQVYEDMRVVPYVLTDVETGEVVTDLNVSATDAKTKAVALDKTLSIPKDVSAADAYQVTGKTWDPEMSKYKLPLFQFFPFCLPWDIYEVLILFDAEPVAPKFTIPVGQFFTRFSGSVDTSKAADQKAVVDLGADSWQSTFKVIRALECAAIIIGLCLTAVLLIHGGR